GGTTVPLAKTAFLIEDTKAQSRKGAVHIPAIGAAGMDGRIGLDALRLRVLASLCQAVALARRRDGQGVDKVCRDRSVRAWSGVRSD
ncbi:MAG: hypothetical protein V4813_19685, partial [Gemmatimonadota bacterium]